MAALWIIIGLVLLTGGAELVVRGGGRLATLVGISPLVVGLTVVAIGTSSPELAIGIDSARSGAGALALGNVAGSNIVNVLLVLGLTAAIAPIAVHTRVIRIDLPVMVGASVVVVLMALDGHLGAVEGAALFLAAVLYTVAVVRTSRDEDPAVVAEFEAELPVETERSAGRIATLLAMTLGGIAVILVGAELLVDGATDAATALGVSDAFIGLTVVALGTSAPELATAIVAAVRSEPDIAVGNVLGSCIYNLLLVLGVTALAAPGGLEVPQNVAHVDLPVALGAAVLCVPVLLTGRRVSRTEGAAFMSLYAAYMCVLLLTRS